MRIYPMKNLTIKNTLFATSMLAAGLAGTVAAYAATLDGTTGATSSGTLDIQLEIQNELKISNLTAIDMGLFTGSDMNATQPACVYFNRGDTASYQVTVDSTDVPGTFELENGGGTTIPYQLEWDDGVLVLTVLTAGTPLVGLDVNGNFSADNDCGGGGATDNTDIRASALATDIIAAGDNGTYQEEVSILVEPDF